ncbi:MAG TPA: glycine zipper 2TM domain-containing protein [Rhizomicrobium sp.]
MRFAKMLAISAFALATAVTAANADCDSAKATGTAVGAVGGGVLGNVVTHGSFVGTAVGAVGGGLVGRSVGHSNGCHGHYYHHYHHRGYYDRYHHWHYYR